MTIEFFTILAVIAVFSVVQSLFGMGVLVFGTPTLLLMGYDFITTLGYLLPASFAISLLQVLAAGKSRATASRYLFILCLPGIGVGLWLAEASPLASWINLLIGTTLLISALVRFWELPRRYVMVLLERYFAFYHLLMGLVHGLTNLGGAFLAILAAGKSRDKEEIRNTVALYYLAFSALQILFLSFVMGHGGMFIANLATAGVSSLVYLLIGKRIFNLTSNPIYNTALTVFIAAYGVVVLLRL